MRGTILFVVCMILLAWLTTCVCKHARDRLMEGQERAEVASDVR